MQAAFLALAALLLALSPEDALAMSGCTLPAAGETSAVSLAGNMHPVVVHTPSGFRASAEPAPLVFLLHGSGSTGEAMVHDSALDRTADAHGFILVAPDAGIPLDRGFAWNIPGVPTVAGEVPGPEARDDVAFLGRIADALIAQGCADPARIYATGLSGGGRMTSWLGCVESRRYAAIAPVVGLRAGRADPDDETQVDPSTCQPPEPMPVLAFAGLQDQTNPVAGGKGMRWGYSMHEAEQRWAALNRCTALPATTWIDREIYDERYGDCAAGAEVAARIDTAGAHSWVVDNEMLWAFLSRHTR